jgi:hypothetical protein
VVAMASDSESDIPSLNDLPLINYINQQGRIQPPVESTTAASVFAICDQNKKSPVCWILERRAKLVAVVDGPAP